MASSKKDNDGVQISAIHDKVSENYTKLSDEFAKSRQQHLQAISGLQQEIFRIDQGRSQNNNLGSERVFFKS